jgi:hypothetical protein
VPGVVNVPPHEYTGTPPAGRSTLTTPDPAGKPFRYGPGAGKNARRKDAAGGPAMGRGFPYNFEYTIDFDYT